MYFIELLVKKFKKKADIEPIVEDSEEDDESPCEHIFMPIDSTGKVFACRNCGLVIKK